MKKLIRILIVLTIVTSLLSFVGNAAGAPTYNWKIQHIRPMDTDIDKDVHWLVDTIKERSNGRINIDIFPSSQLGDYTVVQERVGIGDVEMQLACIGTRMDPSLMLQSLPYIARNWDDAKELGFVSAGGGEWYSRTLNQLNIGEEKSLLKNYKREINKRKKFVKEKG